jgi:hypothetical protein
MSNALKELETRLLDLTADVDFVAAAANLRPRLGNAFNWDASDEVTILARAFMGAKASRRESLYGAVLVRILATLERYVRQVIDDVVARRTREAESYDELSAGLGRRNMILTGQALIAIHSQREQATIDLKRLVANLATCSEGGKSFALNGQLFAAAVTGSSPAIFEKALGYVEIDEWWDDIGRGSLSNLLGTTGARATGKRAEERLRELWRWRNQIAHGGDDEIALNEPQLRDAIQFVHEFSRALDASIEQRLARHKSDSAKN